MTYKTKPTEHDKMRQTQAQIATLMRLVTWHALGLAATQIMIVMRQTQVLIATQMLLEMNNRVTFYFPLLF